MRKSTTILILLFSLFAVALSACAPAATTPPTPEAAAISESDFAADLGFNEIEILQNQVAGSGKMVLYRWQNGADEACVATAYLTQLNGRWQTHTTATTDCSSDTHIIAAYTGNSVIQSEFGAPRMTAVYGITDEPFAHAVQIVWSDGQVSRLPLEDGAFLAVRQHKLVVERIEVFDANNNLLFIEDWQPTQLSS